jgi:hypothetical protein
MTDRRRRTDRGQAITLNYAVGLGIGVILITGLLIAGGNFVTDQRETAARSELRVIGQQLSADISTADRLAQSADGEGEVSIRRTMPQRVAGTSYNIELVDGSDPALLLNATGVDVRVRVEVTTETSLDGNAIDGGKLRVNQTDSGALTIESVGDES